MIPAESNAEFKKVYEAYGHLVFSRCQKILGSEDEAWDATQDVFIKLMKHYVKIKKKGSLLSWLYSVSTNHCFSILRKKRSIEFDELQHSEASNRKGEDKTRELIVRELIERFMQPWNESVRKVVVYTYVDGYTQPEISKLMNLGESTIRRYLTNFRRKAKSIKDELEGAQ